MKGGQMGIQANPRTNRSLLNTEEFAAALGLSPKTIRNWVWTRRVSYLRVGRAIRFRPETVEEILNRGAVPALEQRGIGAQ